MDENVDTYGIQDTVSEFINFLLLLSSRMLQDRLFILFAIYIATIYFPCFNMHFPLTALYIFLIITYSQNYLLENES